MTEQEYQAVKAFDEGMKAQQEGRKKSDCPYAPGSYRCSEWINGYEVMVLSKLRIHSI
jgi:ribosome modulation factor